MNVSDIFTIQDLMCFKKLFFLKILSLVLNLLSQNADLLLRSGDGGPTASL